MKSRIIFAIDIDAFFAQAEEIRNPKLKNKAIAIGHRLNNRGVLSTSNYQARKYGIYSGQPIFKALKKLSNLLIIEPDFQYYVQLSEKIFKFLANNYSQKIEIASIDECYLELTDKINQRNNWYYAKKIQTEILKNFKITVSIGISTNKSLAKIASNLKKPMGISQLYIENIEKILWQLPLTKLPGIGLKTEKKLNNIGINKIGELANISKNSSAYLFLRNNLGINFYYLHQKANGIDYEAIQSNYHYLKSISHAVTFPEPISDFNLLKEKLLQLTKIIVDKIHYRNFLVQTVYLQTKKYNSKEYKKTQIIQKKLQQPSENLEEIFTSILTIFESWYQKGKKVNYLSVGVKKITSKNYLGKQQYLDEIEEINNKNIDSKEEKKIRELISYLNKLSNGENFATGKDYQKNKFFKDNRYLKNDLIKFKKW